MVRIKLNFNNKYQYQSYMEEEILNQIATIILEYLFIYTEKSTYIQRFQLW